MTHDELVCHHEWEACEGIRQHAERIASLEELVLDMWNGMCGYGHDCRSCEHYKMHEGQRLVGECQYHIRMREL